MRTWGEVIENLRVHAQGGRLFGDQDQSSMFEWARQSEDEIGHIIAAMILSGEDASRVDEALREIEQSWQQRANNGGSLGES